MKTIEQIKQEVEELLITGMAFEYILRSNPRLYDDKLRILINENDYDSQNFNISEIQFDYKPEGIKFIGEPIIFKFSEDNPENYNYYEAIYISDFNFNGFIYKTESDHLELNLEGTLRIFSRNIILPSVNGWVEIPKIIDVLDKDSYTVWDRKDKQKEIQKLQNQLHVRLN